MAHNRTLGTANTIVFSKSGSFYGGKCGNTFHVYVEKIAALHKSQGPQTKNLLYSQIIALLEPSWLGMTLSLSLCIFTRALRISFVKLRPWTQSHLT